MLPPLVRARFREATSKLAKFFCNCLLIGWVAKEVWYSQRLNSQVDCERPTAPCTLDANHLHPTVNDTPIPGAGTRKTVSTQARDKVRANCSV